MALPKSSLSQVCRAIADFVSDGLAASTNSFRVVVGNPASTAPSATETEHRVNLFFYRIEPAPLYGDTTPGDTLWLRLFCLVTGFGAPEERISAGENDLRLLGEVMRLFHEFPVLPDFRVGDEEFRLQVLCLPVTSDELNHIWSTQGEVSFRPSIAYEFSLAPLIPGARRPADPLVGRIGAEVRGDREGRTASFSGTTEAPPVPRTLIDTRFADWAPAICFVDGGSCATSVAFQWGSSELAGFTPRVWVAGAPAALLSLVWQRWTSDGGWQEVAGSMAATATTTLIDPEAVAEATPVSVPLPAELLTAGGQAVLFAERRYVRAQDGVQVTRKSNPLLVTVYGAP